MLKSSVPTCLFGLFFFLSTFSIAQNHISNFKVFDNERGISANDFINNKSNEYFQLDGRSQLIIKEKKSKPNGWKVYRLKHHYDNLPVLNSQAVLYEKFGQVKFITNNIQSFQKTNTSPLIPEAIALQAALNEIPAQLYAWEHPIYQKALRTDFPKGELKILHQHGLCWEFDVFSLAPEVNRQKVYIHAVSGQPIHYIPLIKNCTPTTGKGYSNYIPGLLEFTVDSCDNIVYLQDFTRAQGIIIYDALGFNAYPQVVVANEDACFDEGHQRNATEGMWALQALYDYLSENYDTLTLIDSMSLITWVNFGNLNNAFYDGLFYTFGSGDGTNFNSFTAPDIIFHEILHGIIRQQNDLVYHGYTGAIEEGICDGLANLLESILIPSANKDVLGENVPIFSDHIRPIANPADDQYPDTYLSDFWQSPEDCQPSVINDFCYIHTNCSVISKLTYLIAHGQTGINTENYFFEIDGIGVDRTLELFFKLIGDGHLTPNINFVQLREIMLSTAFADMNNISGFEYTQICASFQAVGLGNCDSSNGNISIIDPVENSVYYVGDTILLSWETENVVGDLKIEFSLNDGATWITLEEQWPSQSSEFRWAAPNYNSFHCRLRVTSIEDFLVYDISNKFALFSCDLVASFTNNGTSFCLGESLFAQNSSVQIDTPLIEWILNDSILAIDEQSITYTFEEAGNYNLKMVIDLEDGCMDTITKTIQVFPEPTANFQYTLIGNTLSLNAEYPYANNYVITINSENLISNSPNFTTTLQTDGEYTVCLNVLSNCGDASACQTIEYISEASCEGLLDSWELHLYNNNFIDGAFDSSYLWLITDLGITRLDTTTGHRLFYNALNTPLACSKINTIAVHPDNTKYFGTDNGVYTFDGVVWDSINQANSSNWLFSNQIEQIFIRPDSTIIVGTDNGISIRNNDNSAFPLNNVNGSLLSHNIYDIYPSLNGKLWVSTDSAISRFNEAYQLEFRLTENELEYAKVNTIVDDPEGFTWLGTNNGMYKLEESNILAYYHEYPHYNTGNPFALSSIEDLSIDDNGNLWIVNYANHITSFDRADGWQSFVQSPWDLTKPIFDENNNLWVLSTSHNLVELNPQSGEITSISTSTSDQPTFTDFDFAPNGDIWYSKDGIITFYDGVNETSLPNIIETWENAKQFEFDQNVIWISVLNTVYKYNTDPNFGYKINIDESNQMESIRDIKKQGNRLWIGASNGLFIYEDGVLSAVEEDNDFFMNSISDIAIYEDQAWFVGNSSKLGHFNEENGFEVIDAPGEFHRQVKVDHNGVVWVLTASPYFCISIWDHCSYLYAYSNGNWTEFEDHFPMSQVSHLAISPSNQIWMAGSGLLVQFDSITNEKTIYNNCNSPLPVINPSLGFTSLHIRPDGSIWVNVNGSNEDFHDGHFIFRPTIEEVVADFSLSNNYICEKDSFEVYNTSLGTEEYLLLVQNDTLAENEPLRYAFDAPGEYLISIIAINEEGCPTTYSENIQVFPKAKLDHLADQYSTCEGSLLLTSNIEQLESYAWYFGGQIISTEDNIIVDQSGFYTLRVTDYCGGEDEKIIYVIAEECVLPGDTNGDGIVNHFDLLPLGIFYGVCGSARDQTNAQCSYEPSLDWPAHFNNINAKHIDTNGDGCCSTNDFFIIEGNYGCGIPNTSTNSSITPLNIISDVSVTPTAENGGIMQIDLSFLNEFNADLLGYGLAFTIEYDIPGINFASPPFIDFSNTSLGETRWEDFLSIEQFYPNEKKIEAAITRIDQTNINASSIGTIVFQVVEDEIPIIVDSLLLTINITGGQLINNEGNLIPIDENNTTYVIQQGQVTKLDEKNTPVQKELIHIMPNPNTGLFSIEFKETPAQNYNTNWVIIDLNGTEVFHSNNVLNGQAAIQQLDLSHLPKGLYIIKVQNENHFDIQKIVIQ